MWEELGGLVCGCLLFYLLFIFIVRCVKFVLGFRVFGRLRSFIVG